jgi:uncharacterized protein YdeI (YjbR/CyaY-like superfamily)
MTSALTGLKPRFFTSASAFRTWLEHNHGRKTELWVGFYKKASGRKGITYPEAVDTALCFGWIDGIKKRVDKDSYTHRFSPRRAGSIWSAINTRRATELVGLGQMAPPGLEVFERRDRAKTKLYSYENRPAAFAAALERTFRANAAAWTFFRAQPPGYQKLMIFYVMSAKKDEARLRRLAALIKSSAEGVRIR